MCNFIALYFVFKNVAIKVLDFKGFYLQCKSCGILENFISSKMKHFVCKQFLSRYGKLKSCMEPPWNVDIAS